MDNPVPNLLLLGAGGHACVVADAALRQGAWTAVAASGADAAASGDLLPGVPQRARAAALAAHGVQPVHVAIGDNAARRREALALPEGRLVSVVHPQASVSPHAQVAPGCFIGAQAVVAPRAALSVGVIVNHGAVVDHDCQIGAFAHIAPGASLAGGVRVGEGVLVGAGARLLPGVSVCAGATIGAGTVVTENIAEPGTYAGVPARRLS